MAPMKCKMMYRQLWPRMNIDTPKNSPAYSRAKQAIATYARLLNLLGRGATQWRELLPRRHSVYAVTVRVTFRLPKVS